MDGRGIWTDALIKETDERCEDGSPLSPDQGLRTMHGQLCVKVNVCNRLQHNATDICEISEPKKGTQRN